MKRLNFIWQVIKNWFIDGDSGLKRFNYTVLLIALLALVALGLTWSSLPLQIWPFDSIYGIYNKDFWSSCLVNFHTSVVDFALLTIIAGKITDKIDKSREDTRQKIEDDRRKDNELRIFEEERILGKAKLLPNEGVSHKAFFALLQLGKMQAKGSDGDRLNASELSFCGLSPSASASYTYYNFSQSKFSGCTLKKWIFTGCLMKHTQFSGAETNLVNAEFKDCTLYRASYDGASIQRAEFKSCMLEEVSFKGAALANINFRECDFRKVDFTGANLKNISFFQKYPSVESLKAADVVFPIYVNSTECKDWPDYVQACRK